MRRLHLIEIHEQTWCPAQIRDAATDFLRFFSTIGDPYGRVRERLTGAVRQSGAGRVVDLCSGGGGPWPAWLRRGQANGHGDVRVLLTDAYPNRSAFERASSDTGGRIEFAMEPVDAAAVPAELAGFRTLFASFHHFRPEKAHAILRDAAARGEGIAVVELGARRMPNLLAVCLVPLLHLLSAPFFPPFRWSRLFWTYLVPVVPLVLLFDGVVSCFRTYSPGELREMVGDLGGDGYGWEIGSERIGDLPIHLTYLIGRRLPGAAAPAAGNSSGADTP